MDNQSNTNNNHVDIESFDDNEINFSEVKNNILKIFEENMN